MAKKANNSSTKDYENLGRMLVSIYETGYLDRNQQLKNSFLKGLLSGLGGVIGATLVVALLLWLLSVLGHVPLIGPVIDNTRETIQQK